MKVKKEKLAAKDFYVNEDLTYSNLKLLKQAGQDYKDHAAWSIDGVFVKVDDKIRPYKPNLDSIRGCSGRDWSD